MNTYEKKFIDAIFKYKDRIFIAVITVLAVVIRYRARDFQSMDFSNFLFPWFEQIKKWGGITSLSEQVGNYGLLYQTLIALMTYNNIDCLYQYKLLSCIFDFGCAFAIAELIAALLSEKRFSLKYNIAYAVVLMMPTSVINSAYWAQCDSIYTFFLLLTILFMYKEYYKSAFVMFGVAFAFKLQSVFLLPFLICCWIIKKKFSLMNFIISLGVFWSSGILAYINGRPLTEAFKIYFDQSSVNLQMFANFPSFWMFFTDNYGAFKTIPTITAITLMGVFLYFAMYNYKKMNTGETFINTAAWFLWTAVLFLPNMHDRYAYPLDMLLILLSFIDIKYAKYAIVSLVLSLVSYGNFLCNWRMSFGWQAAAIYFIAWCLYSYRIIKKDLDSNIK